MPSSGRDILDRAALVHRWDCPAVAEPALPEPDIAEIDALYAYLTILNVDGFMLSPAYEAAYAT